MHASYSVCPLKNTQRRHCDLSSSARRRRSDSIKTDRFGEWQSWRREKYPKWTSALRQHRRHISSRAELIKKISFEDHILCLMLAYNNIFMIPRASAFWGQDARWMENKFNLWLALMRYQNASPESHPKKKRNTERQKQNREATRMHYEMSRSWVPCAIRHHFFQFLSRRTQPPAKKGKKSTRASCKNWKLMLKIIIYCIRFSVVSVVLPFFCVCFWRNLKLSSFQMSST